ncbi:MAG: thymidylate synthase [Candidatus Riesia sp.]|nr:thymidylate synthase [Candidatus Riesia sp.]
MYQYLNLLKAILDNGELVKTRNGNRLTIYGYQMRFNLKDGFPIVTTSKKRFDWIVQELIWFLNGETNTKQLKEWGNPIWDLNADENGNVGKIYGYQYRHWLGKLDQIQRSITLAKKAPYSTRNIVTAWNPDDMDEMKLPPCHLFYQVHCLPNNKLILQWSQRSADAALGIPYNISSYALLAHLYGVILNREPVELICDLGNVHLYEPHIENARKQSLRKPYELPQLNIKHDIPEDLKNMQPDWFELVGYKSHPYIKYEMVV